MNRYQAIRNDFLRNFFPRKKARTMKPNLHKHFRRIFSTPTLEWHIDSDLRFPAAKINFTL